MKNAMIPTTSSATSGMSGFGFCSAARRFMAATLPSVPSSGSSSVSSSGAEDEGHDQADERQRLGQREAEQHVLADQVVGLRLTRDGLHAHAEDDADADTRADGRKAVADQADAAGDLSEHVSVLLCRPVDYPLEA